jgi:hypothetical protein
MHKNRRLFDLATRNAQRQALEEFLASQPQFHNILAASPAIYHPELSELLRAAVHQANELQDKSEVPEGTMVLKTSSGKKALSSLTTWISELPPGRYICVVGESNGIRFDGESQWVSKMPGQNVTLPDQQTELCALVAACDTTCIIYAHDGDTAIISDAVSGWLPDEPSAEETVFELTRWNRAV